MSLKSIRESYSKLLTAFTDAGMKLNESQKSDLDTFVLALESTMSKQRQDVIRKTKKAVEAKFEKEYSALFESIMDNVAKNSELETKIKVAKAQISESKKIAGKVNDYLDLYVESVLPKKTIVDYKRMHKLETIHESLKHALALDEDVIVEKKQQLEESYKKAKSKLETEVAKMKAKLNESMNANLKMKKKLNEYKAMSLLESKTAHLPSYEARKVKKMLSEATVEEIESKFDKTLAKVQNETKSIVSVSEKSIDEEIDNIVNVDEDDVVRGGKHNLDVDGCDILDLTPHNNKDMHNAHGTTNPLEEDEMFETTEDIQFNECGDVVLNDSDVIDEATMTRWCAQVRL